MWNSAIRMGRAAIGLLSLACISWVVREFWRQDHSQPRYDPTAGVAIGVAVSLVCYAALSAGMERVEGRERFVFPALGLVLWGFTFGQLLLYRSSDALFALLIALLPAILFVKAVQLVARDAELMEKNPASPADGPQV